MIELVLIIGILAFLLSYLGYLVINTYKKANREYNDAMKRFHPKTEKQNQKSKQ